MTRVLPGVLILISVAAASAAPAAPRRSEALAAAESVARWLSSLERSDPMSGALSWPRSDRSAAHSPGIDGGAAGIGGFHLRLYRASGDVEALDRARRAADFVFARYEAGSFDGPDWLAGAAGGGSFFLDLYDATGEPVYRARAAATARALMSSAYGDAERGYHWRHSPQITNVYTGTAHGAVGIGLFFLRAYEATGERDFLAYAEGAWLWTTGYAVALGPGASGLKRLTTDTTAYHLWCGGSTGAIPFLARLYAVTGREIYREALRSTAEGLVLSARPRSGGYAWNYGPGGGSTPIAFCHGATSVALSLYQAYQVLGDPRYLDHARGALTWVETMARPRPGGGALWEHIANGGWLDTGYFTGTASVGRAFAQAHGLDPDPRWIQGARDAAAGLLAVAERPAPDQLRWPTYVDPPRASDPPSRDTGVYSGAAGVGLFFLDLHEAEAAAAAALHRRPAR